MLRSHTPTRIGDILIERGIISRAQLLKALDYQQAKQLMTPDMAVKDARNELGEILIELGFISREQLKQNLARQSRLRKTRLVVSFVAPLFTMACGGGGGGASTPPVTKPAQTTSSSVVGEKSSSAQISSLPPQSPNSSSSSSSRPATGTVTTSAQKSSSSKAVSSAQQSSAAVSGPVVLYWTAPTRRLNGEQLDITEIGGYEIRYKQRTQNQYASIKIPDGFTDSYYFDYLEGQYEFEIAAYDIEGLYSNFVPINPVE
jgi:hypothetical protein